MKSEKYATGGHRGTVEASKKKLSWKGGEFAATRMDAADQVKLVKVMGNHVKAKQTHAHTANVTNPETRKTMKMEITWVHENNANRLFTRRNIITKGAVIEVSLDGIKAFARVASRPGQQGQVNALMLPSTFKPEKMVLKEEKAQNTKTRKTAKTAKRTPPSNPKKEA
ncbi:MAG: 30S ribosomal protein S8e [Candidatus Diapherotrites archaeon]|nr:30S ribosomal protein S8e [Candidatus Diapherotrites archaeon]